MTYNTRELDDFALPLPIPQAARETAERFASQQPTAQKAEQVQLNTLAVWVVNDYLHLMSIPTQLDAGDSWNPILRLCADVADLEIPGLGRLECRPVRVHAQTCFVPPEVWEERIGYVAVQIDQTLQEAQILGFFPDVVDEFFPLSELRSPEALLDQLHHLQQATQLRPVAERSSLGRNLVDLSQWLDGLFDAGWQAVESLLSPPQLSPAFAFRGVEAPNQAGLVRRAKLISLELPVGESPVVLVVDIQPQGETTPPQAAIRLQVHPFNQAHLPVDLQLSVLDEAGAIFLQAQSEDIDRYLQLEFTGTVEETFGIELRLGEVTVIEDFVI